MGAGPPRSAIVAYAEKWIGLPYQFGGGDDTGPTIGDDSNGSGRPGFDCSGLTMYAVYQATHGQINLDHFVPDQLNNPHVQRVGYNQLQPGDLVFFPGSDGTTTDPGHVGIYTGHQQIIDAPYTGVDIRLDSIAAGSLLYNTFISGGRITP
jgi:cell wall-associated NlpC family hydrolase